MNSFWDRIACVYDYKEQLNRRAYHAMLTEIRACTPKGAKALDCACGTGALGLVMADSAAKVTCMDLSEKMLFKAQQKARRRGVENMRFVKADIFSLPAASESYDVVVAGNVLHLLKDPEKAARELLRVTRTDGCLLLPTYLTKNKGRHMLGLFRMLGFRPERELDAEAYLQLLGRIGLRPEKFTVLQGRIPVGMAVVKKHNDGGAYEKDL